MKRKGSDSNQQKQKARKLDDLDSNRFLNRASTLTLRNGQWTADQQNDIIQVNNLSLINCTLPKEVNFKTFPNLQDLHVTLNGGSDKWPQKMIVPKTVRRLCIIPHMGHHYFSGVNFVLECELGQLSHLYLYNYNNVDLRQCVNLQSLVIEAEQCTQLVNDKVKLPKLKSLYLIAASEKHSETIMKKISSLFAQNSDSNLVVIEKQMISCGPPFYGYEVPHLSIPLESLTTIKKISLFGHLHLKNVTVHSKDNSIQCLSAGQSLIRRTDNWEITEDEKVPLCNVFSPSVQQPWNIEEYWKNS